MQKISINDYRKTRASKDRYYIDNKKFTEEVIMNLKLDRYTEKLGNMFILLIDNMLKHYSFRNYSTDLKAEMKSYTMLRLIRAVNKFKPETNNAYSYFTRICFTSFLNVIVKHYNEVNKKREIIDRVINHSIATHTII